MIKKSHKLFTLVIGLMVVYSCGEQQVENSAGDDSDQTSASKEIPKLFRALTSEESGIDFTNKVVEDNTFNFFFFPYIYHGGGVAIGDINNDDLPDIFFTGNSVPCKLYLNQGNLQFEDISDMVGIEIQGGWRTGVTMADVNNDGYLDIYICRSISEGNNLSKRENLLFINNTNLTFTEMGAAYGLNDASFSTQSTFFDYDKDGDLDMYLVNHPFDFGPFSEAKLAKRFKPGVFEQDKLYRNNGNGSFTDVTTKAGIKHYGFGLSATVSDLNNDGWPDIYVANDFDEPDCIYINNGNGTFTDKINIAVKHISNFSMGVDLADFNNDGLLDIMVLDMMAEDNFRQKTMMGMMVPEAFWSLVDFGYHHQYMRNTLQLNNGDGSFSEIGQLAGIPFTDWSWGPLFADFDNDGLKDLVITNGLKKEMSNKDFRHDFEQMQRSGKMPDFNQTMARIPVSRIQNYIYKNEGNYTFSPKMHEWGFSWTGFSNGCAYADLDRDGDLDLYVTAMGGYPNRLYRNDGEL
ncbi:MAG: VCBS repeat-containing protein, partial [Bacteroidetes bacterium]|nr:VCBS repeat-containing protein [Bacteroidota bacterium]